MKVVFEDEDRKVVWDLPDISIRQRDRELRSGDIACVPLECEIEIITQETSKLRSRLNEPFRTEGGSSVPDPLRMAMALLTVYYAGGIISMNQIIKEHAEK